MRSPILLLPLLAAGCAAPAGDSASLAPRAAEAIDPRVPIVIPADPAPADPALVAQLNALVAQAVAGDEAFRPAAAEASRLAALAGARESESWVIAQQALSAAIAARGPVTRALGEIDALAGQRVQSQGGVREANLEAIRTAAERVAAIDSREAGTIAEIEGRLRR